MNKITINGGKAVISFNPSFYSIESIREAADNYDDILKIKIRMSGNKIIVEMTQMNNNENILNIADEFCNNVLLVMKNKAEV